MKTPKKTLLASIATLFISALSAGADTPVPLVQYRFSEGASTTVANAGSLPAMSLTLGSTAGWAPGVTGNADDYAFSSVTPSGNNGLNSYARTSGAGLSFSGVTQLTIAGWFKMGVGGDGDRYIMGQNGGWGSGFTLRLNTSGNLIFSRNGDGSMTSTGGHFDDFSSEWTFMALTWDATTGSTANAVNFYYGTSSLVTGTDSTVARTTHTTIGATTAALTLGNTSAGQDWYAWNGKLDNFAIYNTALTPSQIEDVRLSALSIPEPSSVVLLSLGLVGAGVAFRRRRLS